VAASRNCDHRDHNCCARKDDYERESTKSRKDGIGERLAAAVAIVIIIITFSNASSQGRE